MNARTVASYIIGLVVLVGLIVWLGSRNTTTATFAKDDLKRPIAEATETSFNLGDMSNQDIRRKVFTVRNTGQSILTLTNVSTSCDCTYAFITAGAQKSPKFTMHGSNSWVGSVQPGGEAQIEVDYEPAIMPVHGQVSRMVTVVTNDPVTPQMMFTVTANLTD